MNCQTTKAMTAISARTPGIQNFFDGSRTVICRTSRAGERAAAWLFWAAIFSALARSAASSPALW